MFVSEKAVCSGVPAVWPLVMAPAAPVPTIQSCSRADMMFVMFPTNTESETVTEPQPLAGVKSLKVFGEVKVIVREMGVTIHTRPSKDAIAEPRRAAERDVNVIPSQENYPL